MTQGFLQATEHLYETFSIYRFDPTMEGCPCCVTESDKQKIRRKPLRKLDGDDLSRYASKAMTTWGDADGFKHYLPRIFELISTNNFIIDVFIVLGKLEYGKWRAWPEAEQIAIENFLFEWWINDSINNSRFDKEVFFEILRYTNNLDKLLDGWNVDIGHPGFLKYVDFVYEQFNNLVTKTHEFKDLDKEACAKILNWMKLNSSKLEAVSFTMKIATKKLPIRFRQPCTFSNTRGDSFDEIIPIQSSMRCTAKFEVKI